MFFILISPASNQQEFQEKGEMMITIDGSVALVAQATTRCSKLSGHISQRELQMRQANEIVNIKIVHDDTCSPDNSITLWQGFRGQLVAS